jgi:hypothetical protein
MPWLIRHCGLLKGLAFIRIWGISSNPSLDSQQGAELLYFSGVEEEVLSLSPRIAQAALDAQPVYKAPLIVHDPRSRKSRQIRRFGNQTVG